MKPFLPSARQQHPQWWALTLVAAVLALLVTREAQAFPISTVTFKDDAPFKGATTNAPLTSRDGLLTVAGWADLNASAATNLYQWWWIFGVNSGVGNGALLDGQESMTLQFNRSVGASHIAFLYTGGTGGSTNNLARISISGFLSDPGAYATTYQAPRISNLSYSGGTLTFDYLYDAGGDYGQLLFANPAATAGQTLKITGATSPNGDAKGWGAALFRVDSQEVYGGPALQPENVKYNATNAYTTPDGKLTVRGYADQNATTPANLGTYVDQCFGVYGGSNNAALDGSESLTLQFAPGFGLARLESVYSSGQVTISGFAADPGFTDNLGGSFGAMYADGVLSFYPMDSGHHVYFFTNRAASAGQTLRINVDSLYTFSIAGIGYADLQTVLGSDIASYSLSYTTADGLLTLTPYADTPGTLPTYLYANLDWFGAFGGKNNEATEGTESMSLQFSGEAGLAGLGCRYTGGTVVIDGFASDPGFTDPSGTATGVSYANGTLSYTFNSWHASEVVVSFKNPAASAGRTLWLHTDGDANAQIALTRISYGVAPVTLAIEKIGGAAVLTWPKGTLQQATSVTGSYSDVVGATSPYTTVISGTQKFFRVKVQ